MPRFYFHLSSEGKLFKDEQGLELPNLSAAQYEALLGAREIVAEAIKSGAQDLPDAFLIADEAGQALETLPFALVLPSSLRSELPATSKDLVARQSSAGTSMSAVETLNTPAACGFPKRSSANSKDTAE